MGHEVAALVPRLNQFFVQDLGWRAIDGRARLLVSCAGMDAEVRKRVDDFIGEKGLRRTSQRDAIVEAAFSTQEHFTAEGLLAMSRKIDPSVSRATVYRTLPLLVQAGVLREMHFGKDYKFYDPNFIDRPHHNHLICLDCNKIVEFEDRHMEVLENCITTRLGFSPIEKTLRIEGKCDELRVFGACKKRNDIQRANKSSAKPHLPPARSDFLAPGRS